MIHSTKKRILAVIAAAVIALSATALMSGCGENGDSKSTTAPTTAQPTTKAPTTAAAANGNNDNNDNDNNNNDNADNQNNDSQSSDDGGQASGGGDQSSGGVEKRGNITSEEAGSIALSRVPYGQTITIVQPGFYGGEECWVVGIADTTGKIYQCYVTSIICEYSQVSPNENPDVQSDASHAEGSENSVSTN